MENQNYHYTDEITINCVQKAGQWKQSRKYKAYNSDRERESERGKDTLNFKLERVCVLIVLFHH